MKSLLSAAIAAAALVAGGAAQAGAFTDTITDAYWGADAHNYQDVIGESMYNINNAQITRVANVLTITIGTNYAGHAGSDSWAYKDANNVYKGIGYGDLFLSDTWSTAGSSANNYVTDNSTTGTVWDYGFSLVDRWASGTTGTDFYLYKLKGATNALNIKNSDSFINCTNCTYRNGQEVAVNTAAGSAIAENLNIKGHMSVLADQSLQFTINVAGTELATFSSIAMHWGETCQNDVIEGIVRLTPIPGTVPLMALGLVGLAILRRRRQA